MWPFDYFKKKREKEEQKRRREEENARLQKVEQERIARERERRLEENRKKEEKRKAEIESRNSISPFTFKSNCHQRYESGTPVQGLQECGRTVSVIKNTNGCPGYRLEAGVGYIVRIFNDDLGKPNMSDKPMKVIRKAENIIELRGFLIEAMSPFGWQEVDYSDYGLTVYYTNGNISKCVLHMYDRGVDLEYRQNVNNDSPTEGAMQKGHLTKKWEMPVSLESLFKKSILFHVERYEQWQQGRCTELGQITFDIHLVADSAKISVTIPHASKFNIHEKASFDFMGSDVLTDRIQYVNAPDACEDPLSPIVLHIFVKDSRIDYIRFAMSYPDRIIEFYGYQIESDISHPSDIDDKTEKSNDNNEYKITFLSSLVNVAVCDGEIQDEEMRTIMAYLQREGLSETDLTRVIANPKSVSSSVPNDRNLRLQHIKDVVTLAMVDGAFSPEEYALCKQIASDLGFKSEIVDIIRQDLNNKIGANI